MRAERPWTYYRKWLNRARDAIVGLAPQKRAGASAHANAPTVRTSLREIDPQFLRLGDKHRGPSVFVQVRRAGAAINAPHFEGWATVDTGSPTSCISLRVAQSLHLKSVGETTLWTAEARKTVPLHHIGLWMPAVDGFHLACPELDVAEHKPIHEDILLGMDVIRRMPLRIDATIDSTAPFQMWF